MSVDKKSPANGSKRNWSAQMSSTSQFRWNLAEHIRANLNFKFYTMPLQCQNITPSQYLHVGMATTFLPGQNMHYIMCMQTRTNNMETQMNSSSRVCNSTATIGKVYAGGLGHTIQVMLA